MTDKNKYRNVSLNHHTHDNVVKLGKYKAKKLGLKHLSIAATIESTVQEAVEKLNGKLSGKN
jgi:hypothetical protein|tara:strand:- start:1393 stop:1578 length:186 start_codon:yes stop_codon:yes gene_type:complete